jgi:hypothetical protein
MPSLTPVGIVPVDRNGSDSMNNLIVKIILPILIVAALLLCCGLYVSYRPRKKQNYARHSQSPFSSGSQDIDVDPNRPDGGISIFDDASIYTSSNAAGFTSNKNSPSNIEPRKEVTSNSASGTGVIKQDFTDTTDASNDDFYEYDETSDFVFELSEENRTITSRSAISSVTPNSFENRQLGYMEEGMMIQERYGRINKELYSSEKTSPTSDGSDIVFQAPSLIVSSPSKESNAVNPTNPQSPNSDEGLEIAFRNDKSDHTAHYDDIVGVENTSTMSYGTSNESSKRSAEHPVGKAMSVSSDKILDMLAEENFTSSEQLQDFDDPAKETKNRTTQPQHHPLSSIALFTRGRNKKGPFGKSHGKKGVDDANDMSQYKADEPYPIMVPSIVDPMNNDDQNSSMIEPFSELTTDFQYGDHDSIGSNEAHIILESIREGAHGLSSSCDSSVNNTHVYENDNDSANASLPFANNPTRRGSDREVYNLNLPLDINGRDDGSTSSQFDNLYESMSNEWEWKQPSQTVMVPNHGGNEDQLRQQGSNKSTGSSVDDKVRELGNIFLV